MRHALFMLERYGVAKYTEFIVDAYNYPDYEIG